MKNIFLLLLLLFSTAASAQKIVWDPQNVKPKVETDQVNENGDRLVGGNFIVSASAKKQPFVRMAISGVKVGDEINLKLIIAFEEDNPIAIADQSPFLIKYKDGTMSEFQINKGDSDDIGKTRASMGIVFTKYSCITRMDLTNEFLMCLTKGIEKMRFEVNNDIFDVILRKDNISNFLMEQYLLVKETLEKKRSFKEGF